MLKFSQAVRPGMVVTRRADQYIRCGRRSRPVGVYQPAATLTLLTDTGRQVVNLPRAVVLSGPTTVQVKA